MPTFLLKKYNQESEVNKENKIEENNSSQQDNNENAPEELTITVTGTISEIVANALNKAFQNKLEVTEVEEKEDTQVKAISTENINVSPIETFNSIHKDDIVFIHNRGFKTSTEEWFLTNIENKTKNVFYTIESFIKFVKVKLAID